MNIGITGHQRLEDDSLWNWVRHEIQVFLRDKAPITGFSSLASGADQIFAECVLQCHGSLVAVIPFEDYHHTFNSAHDVERYWYLRSQSRSVQILPAQSDDQESYLAAGRTVVQSCEVLIAVWDGLPAKGKGGTGDAVEYALSINRRVIHVNPYKNFIKEIASRS